MGKISFVMRLQSYGIFWKIKFKKFNATDLKSYTELINLWAQDVCVPIAYNILYNI